MVSVVGRVTGENAIETSDGVAVSISAHSLEFPARCASPSLSRAARPRRRARPPHATRAHARAAPRCPATPRATSPHASLRSGCVEVVGTIEDGACLSPTRFCSFGEEFDLKNYDDLVGHIEGKYKDLFQ